MIPPSRGAVTPQKVPGPDDPPSECAKELFLAAAAYFPSDPNRWMIAPVGPNELDAQPLYQQGTQIGNFELVAIYPNMAYLKRPSGDYCSLKLYSKKHEKKSKRKGRSVKRRKEVRREKGARDASRGKPLSLDYYDRNLREIENPRSIRPPMSTGLLLRVLSPAKPPYRRAVA